jgi:hypothetical protein
MLPDDITGFVDRAHSTERNTGDDSVLSMQGEAVGARIHADRRERDHAFLVDDPVVIAEPELSSRELRVPLDAMEEFLEGLHLVVPAASGSRHRQVLHQDGAPELQERVLDTRRSHAT